MTESDDDVTPKKPPQRTVSVPLAMFLSLAGSAASAAGTQVMSASTSREGQIRLELQVQALRDDLRRIAEDQRAALGRLDARDDAFATRLSQLEREVWTGRGPAQPR